MATLFTDIDSDVVYATVGTGTTATPDTTDTYFGGRSIAVTGNTNQNAGLDINGAAKFDYNGPANRQVCVGLVKVSDYTKINKLQAIVYSPGGSGNIIYEYDIENGGGVANHQFNGWHLVPFIRGSGDNGGSNRGITRLIWRGDPVTGEDVGELKFDAIWLNARQKSVIIFTFDDGHQRSIDDGLYWLEENYGWHGGIGPIVEDVGTVGASPYSTIEQLRECYRRGHDVYVHGGTDLEIVDDDGLDAVRADVRANLAMVKSIGDRAANFYVYPNGGFTRDINLLLKEEGFDFCRMATSSPTSVDITTPVPSINGWIPPEREIPYVLRNINVNATAAADSFNDAAAAMDYCITTGAPIILSIHDLYDSGASDPHINLADFRSFVTNHVVPRVNRGLAEVVTPSQWWNILRGRDRLRRPYT